MAAPTIIQIADEGTTNSKRVLATPGTVGNTLIGVVFDRDFGGTGVEMPPLGGWIEIATGVDAIGSDRAATVLYHVIEADESPYTSGGDSVTYNLTPSTNQHTLMIEIDGVYAGIFAERDSVPATTTMNAGGSVTPDAGDDVLIFGAAVIYTNVGGVTEDGGVTALRDEWTGFSPYAWAGYRSVTTASGSYSVGGTMSSSHFAGVTAVFIGSADPFADFTATPTTGTPTLAVTFTDMSTNSPTSWAWDFGDGGTSTSQNPSHNYTVPGVYDVELIATGPGGAEAVTKLGYITVTEPAAPGAMFEWDETVG